MGTRQPRLQVEFDRAGEPVDLGTRVTGHVAVDCPDGGAVDRVAIRCFAADGRVSFRPANPPPPVVLHDGPLPPGTSRFAFALPVAHGPLGFHGGIEIAWGVQAVVSRGGKEGATVFAAFPTAAPGGDFAYAFPPGVEVPAADDVRVSRHTLGNLFWGVIEALFAASLAAGFLTGAFEDGLTAALGVGVGAIAAAFAAVHLRRGIRNLRGLAVLRGLDLRVPVRQVRWGQWIRAEVTVPADPAVTARVELSCVEGYDGGEGESSYRNVLWSQAEPVPRPPAGTSGPSAVEFRVPEGAPPTYRSDAQWLEWRVELQAWPGAPEGSPFWVGRATVVVGP